MKSIQDLANALATANADAGRFKSPLTHPQGKYLWNFTGCKFWEPERIPPPTIKQASVLLDACIEWNKATGRHKNDLADFIEHMVRQWFPEWTKDHLHFRFSGKGKTSAPKAAQTGSVPPFPALPTQESNETPSKAVGSHEKGGESNTPEDAQQTKDAHRTGSDEQSADGEEQDGEGEGKGGENGQNEGEDQEGEGQGKGQDSEDQGENENDEGDGGNDQKDGQNEGEGESEGEGQDEEKEGQESEEKPKKERKPRKSKKQKEQEKKEQEEQQEQEQQEQEQQEEQEQTPEEQFPEADPKEIEMMKLIKAGVRNIWMVGAAGSGKTTMAKNVADMLGVPCTVISCGLGTSAVEFLGYKYPERESTPFAGAFGQSSVIVLDEFTALDPAVAQVANAALANGQITTTTGVVGRHADCVIIATSNTYGDGADRQYVANQQLDGATIDRFMGGIINVSYSEKYESRFDTEVRIYVQALRKLIDLHNYRRIASTRMMIQGQSLKYGGFTDWKKRLIVNWSEEEKAVVEAESLPW